MGHTADKTSRFLEVGIWLLFFALLVPAGFTGWAIGHSTSDRATKTVTVTVSSKAGK
jgi:hypothetical protein